MLAEAQTLGVDADFDEEEVDASEEIPERFVCDDALVDGVADGHLGDLRAAADLHVPIEEAEDDIADFVEPGVALVSGIDKVLDFAHGELAHAEEACAWGDFVAEGAADLG